MKNPGDIWQLGGAIRLSHIETQDCGEAGKNHQDAVISSEAGSLFH